MYSTVPQNEKVFFESSSMDSLLRPKSVSLMWPSAFNRILDRGRGGEGRGGCEQTEEHKAFEEVGGGGEKAVWCRRVLFPSEIRNKQSP